MESHHPPSFERCVGTIRFLPVPITQLFSFSARTSVVCLPTFQLSFPLPLDPRAPFTYFLPLSVVNYHFSIAIFPLRWMWQLGLEQGWRCRWWLGHQSRSVEVVGSQIKGGGGIGR